jgi:hypothetical protein
MHRFLYNNLITTETMFAVSSLRQGIITSAIKEGTGSAELNPSGYFTGAVDKEFIVEIDSISGGAEVGQATFKWSDGGGSWNATGVTTAASGLSLGSGASIGFSSGSGNDFVLGDKWYFKGINLFNAGKMIDYTRDNRYRSAALGSPNTIDAYLASAQEVKAIVIYDHNFTDAATLSIEGDSAPTFDTDGGSAEFSEALTWTDEKIVHFLSAAQTYRYWRLNVTDAANPDAFIEIGELFLGSYLELSRNYVNGFQENIDSIRNANRTNYGIERDRFFNFQRTWNIDWHVITSADAANLKTMFASLGSRSTGTFKPFFFCFDSATPSNTWMVKVDQLSLTHLFLDSYETGLTLQEVIKSA